MSLSTVRTFTPSLSAASGLVINLSVPGAIKDAPACAFEVLFFIVISLIRESDEFEFPVSLREKNVFP